MAEEGTENRTDVSQILEQDIPVGEFPAPVAPLEFRVYIAPDVHEQVLSHARTHTSLELCGVLLGQVMRDSLGAFAVIDAAIEGKHARNRSSQVTFTHDTWQYIYSVKDSRYPDSEIVGWYHTHPGFGIFLSHMDRFIHHNFFSRPWQVALVVDPLSGREGLFEWRRGETCMAQRYWVGGRMQTCTQVPSPFAGIEPAPEADTYEKEQPAAAPRATDRPIRVRSLAWDVVQVALLLAILLMLTFQDYMNHQVGRLMDWVFGR